MHSIAGFTLGIIINKIFTYKLLDFNIYNLGIIVSICLLSYFSGVISERDSL